MPFALCNHDLFPSTLNTSPNTIFGGWDYDPRHAAGHAETSLVALRRPNAVKLVELLKAKKGPLKSGIAATSKRFGALGPYGSMHRKNLSHHGIGLVDSGDQNAYYHEPYDYGYDGYHGYHGYDGYDYGGYGGYDGYDQYGYAEDAYGAPDAYGELGQGPDEAVPMDMPMPEGDTEALKEEQDAENLQQCMARCPVWDPLTAAKPEDLQHASLVVLQRLARPERRLAPSLRSASAAVDAAGRSLERWVRKRQDLARELPKMRKIMMQCKSMQDKQDDEQMETDLQALRSKTEQAHQNAKAKEQEAEEAQESMVMQDVGHMQGKADRWALEQAMQEQDHRDAVENSEVKRAVNGYNQQGANLQQRQMEEAQKEMARMASSTLEIDVPKDAGSAGLADAADSMLSGKFFARPQDWLLGSYSCGYYDEYGRYWEEDWGGYYDTDGTYYKKEDHVEAVDEMMSWKEWFEKCGQIRIPPSIIATRRAASEAYWDFDRSLAVAERAVDNALTS
ncbi:unnamed protein product, partial [Cladocopium goreaui]